MKRLLLIDGNNYVYRSFHAVKDLQMTGDGIPTNAVRGFFQILRADIRVLQPTHLAVSFDRTPSYRRLEMYPEYKGTRTHAEGDLARPQMQIIRKLLRSAGIRTIGVVGEETDDIIATLATKFEAHRFEVLISSTDKDFAQLVTKKVRIVEAVTRNILGEQEIKDKYGVYPHQIHDYLTLMGDKVDNVPGVPGIAKKTASKLITQYDDLKGVIRAAKKGKLTRKLGENLLIAYSEGGIRLARNLTALYKNVDLNLNKTRFHLASRKLDEKVLQAISDELGLQGTANLIRSL